MTVMPIDQKFRAFGWDVLAIDGHDFEQIDAAIEHAKHVEGKPTLIVCETVKGKGVSFMENVVDWHGVAPTAEQAEAALAEIRAC